MLPVALCAAKDCPISHTPCPGFCIYADIMQSVNLGVVVLDVSRRSVFFVNQHAAALLAQVGAEPSFDGLCAMLLPPGTAIEDVGSSLSPEPVSVGTRLFGYTLYGARDFVWAFVRDITDKARLESIAEAVESMNNIGYVFSAVRHELGNPINSVKTALSVLRANLERFSRETVVDYLDGIMGEVARIEELLRSLKSFSMFERLEPQPVDVRTFLQDFRILLERDLAGRRGVALSFEADAGMGWTHCDPRALQHVLLNLVANAADAVEGVPNPRIRLEVSRSGALVRFVVSDNGCGISEEGQSHLFKPFFTTKKKGTGLGLVIVKKMVTRMNGTIGIASVRGGGTTVTVTLPEAP